MYIRDLLARIEALAPLSRAANWDNCGLQVGSPDEPLKGVLISVNPSSQALQAAIAQGANLVVAHHPLIFKATKVIDTRHDPGRSAALAMAHGITVYAAHTNLDATACNHHLSKLFGIPMDRPIDVMGVEPVYRLGVGIPPEDALRVLEAMWQAGAGRSERYDQASFLTDGETTFRPLPGSQPAEGEVLAPSRQPLVRAEVLVKGSDLAAVKAAMRAAHPYEEPVFDVIRLESAGEPFGIGLWGELPEPMTVSEVLSRVKQSINPRSLRLVGDASRKVRRIGVCSGSGGDLAYNALKQGVECFITGELRYHTALDCLDRGLTVIEAGHQATEQPVVDYLVDALRPHLPPSIPILGFSEPEPFEVIQ
ncbi:putative GTP cyclohydrolase 1 type 2 [compost metagenome]